MTSGGNSTGKTGFQISLRVDTVGLHTGCHRAPDTPAWVAASTLENGNRYKAVNKQGVRQTNRIVGWA